QTYMLIVPLVLGGLAWKAWKQRQPKPLLFAMVGLALLLTPLATRNICVGAPVFSTSNRFSEAIVQGHAASGHPSLFFIPPDTRELLERSHGNKAALIKETLATHHGLVTWCRFELSKVLSLLD